MSVRDRKRRSSDRIPQDRWLVSYADFITLLFAFFVVLYASSRADQQKQMQVAHSIEAAFQAMGLFPAASPPRDTGGSPPATQPAAAPINVLLGDDLSASPAVQQDLRRLQDQLASVLAPQIAEHVVALRLGRDGLVISLREAGFYQSGSALPDAQSKDALDKVAAKLIAVPYDLRVEGHTDNVPIHTAQFASNWELSTARASELVKILIVRYKFSPRRLSAAGYAEYHPVAANDTAEGRSQNRRVDIIVLPRITIVPAGSQAR
ncbi:MAG TPA: flagellar motor protein MotB [Acidobacteriaceae bacterium]|jgi:chemotaxis protein MotB|nr:flagellar motor protein MotB [Acidobacteriaceae bacterium]